MPPTVAHGWPHVVVIRALQVLLVVVQVAAAVQQVGDGAAVQSLVCVMAPIWPAGHPRVWEAGAGAAPHEGGGAGAGAGAGEGAGAGDGDEGPHVFDTKPDWPSSTYADHVAEPVGPGQLAVRFCSNHQIRWPTQPPVQPRSRLTRRV